MFLSDRTARCRKCEHKKYRHRDKEGNRVCYNLTCPCAGFEAVNVYEEIRKAWELGLTSGSIVGLMIYCKTCGHMFNHHDKLGEPGYWFAYPCGEDSCGCGDFAFDYPFSANSDGSVTVYYPEEGETLIVSNDVSINKPEDIDTSDAPPKFGTDIPHLHQYGPGEKRSVQFCTYDNCGHPRVRDAEDPSADKAESVQDDIPAEILTPEETRLSLKNALDNFTKAHGRIWQGLKAQTATAAATSDSSEVVQDNIPAELLMRGGTLEELLARSHRYRDKHAPVQNDSESVESSESDAVNHPSHYNGQGPEVIELVRWMPFNRGNAIKYIARAGKKDPVKEEEDILKAIWYLEDELKIIRGEVS